MKTCCVLHNMLLDFDGTHEVSWETLDPDANVSSFVEESVVAEDPVVDVACTDEMEYPAVVTLKHGDIGYQVFKRILMNNFLCRMQEGKVRWPGRNNKAPGVVRVVELVLARVDRDIKRNYRIQASGLRAYDANSGEYTRCIGNGLFSQEALTAGKDLLSFRGYFIDAEAMCKIQAEGYAGYAIRFNENLYLDCRSKCETGLCYASYANDPSNCKDKKKVGNPMAVANAKLVINRRLKNCYLRSISAIKAGDEILWIYSANGEYFTEHGAL